MLEAMWALEFLGTDGAKLGEGGGIIVFETGRVFGGDSSFAYVGSFTAGGGRVTVTVHVTRHAPGLESVTGMDDYTLVVRGDMDREAMELRGYAEGMQELPFIAKLRRIAELP